MIISILGVDSIAQSHRASLKLMTFDRFDKIIHTRFFFMAFLLFKLYVR